jgi:hypothetical protein
LSAGTTFESLEQGLATIGLELVLVDVLTVEYGA